MAVQGILENVSLLAEQQNQFETYARRLFFNQTPLLARLNPTPVGSTTFEITVYDVKPRAYTLTGAVVASGSTATLTLTDASPLVIGDVLNLLATAATATVPGTPERLEVTALLSATTVTVRRARGGTALIANDLSGVAASKVVKLVGNSRTGAEIDQPAARFAPTTTLQYVQTFQEPVQVGGLANAVMNNRLPAGVANIFEENQGVALASVMEDIEYTLYYGRGEAAAAVGDRPKMKGLRQLIAGYGTGSPNIIQGLSSYTRLGAVSGAVQAAVAAGGAPDIIMGSLDTLTGLATWANTSSAITPVGGRTSVGDPIEEFIVPYLGKPMTFVMSPMMEAGTMLFLTSGDLRLRRIRPLFFNLRGNRGDAIEGEFIGDYALELAHPGWHAWVENISSYA